MFRDRFWLSLVLTIPTLVWGHMLLQITGWQAPAFPGSEWIAPVFGTAVFLYGGRVFLQGAVGELKARLPGMMTLIALAISVAFVFSAAVTLGYPGMPLWEELATLVTVMLLGHWIEMRSIFQAQGALRELAKLLPVTAERVVGERTEEVPVDALRDGDVVLIRPGASIPADGIVRSGGSSVNEAMITGESRHVPKGEGDEVIAGTSNGEGSLRVEVTKTGEKTALAGIMRLVEEAQSSRSRAQALADRAAFFLTLVAVAAGLITAVAWLGLGAEASFVVERVVSTLVVACPHALGLAIPLVIAISTTMGARSGLLVRDRRGLEEARNLDAVVFDKTGTLTLGEHRVVSIRTASGVEETEALRLAAAVERDSEHAIARAILASAEERGIQVPAADGFEAIPGHGVRARVDGRGLEVGGPNLLRQRGVSPAKELADAAAEAASKGQSAVYLLEDDHALAVFAIADAIRPESAEAVRRLHENGIEIVMLTGDSRAVADAVARELGIDTVFAEVLPEDKVRKIEELESQGKQVAMVGDGVNDAPALLAATVGIAIGAGTDVAVEAGDVVLVRSDPRDVPRIVELSKASYRKMVQNLWWAAGYNIVAIPLAAGVLAGYGILLAPAVAAILMSASTVIVAINAQLLRRESI
ncbi:MAG TPA: heavy metal translocating P-type ATPase [Gemmatimonadota bacterium]|nr:heavy metal translocating P-type ATPase [Gemmatimonadota bacterium]HET6362659.1 heavy metal translocating P-type ATPase [Gemmatimonadota bacterium]